MKKLGKNEMMNMEKAMVMRKVSKDTMLHFPEMQEKYVYFLKEGLVKIVHFSEEGKEAIKYLVAPGNIFGELALLENQESGNNYAVAVNDCTICFMNVEDLNLMMKEYKDLSINIRKLIGLRIKKLERRVESLIFKDARARIMEFLEDLGNDFGYMENEKRVIRNFLTHDEIAKLTASSRQTVTSVLNELRNRGDIEYNSKFITFNAPGTKSINRL